MTNLPSIHKCREEVIIHTPSTYSATLRVPRYVYPISLVSAFILYAYFIHRYNNYKHSCILRIYLKLNKIWLIRLSYMIKQMRQISRKKIQATISASSIEIKAKMSPNFINIFFCQSIQSSKILTLHFFFHVPQKLKLKI